MTDNSITMNVYFYTFHRSQTGEYLYNRLKAKLIQNVGDIPTDKLSDKDVLIRWGRSDNEWLDKKFTRVFNKAEAIHSVYDKAGFLVKCSRNGIRVPKVWFNPNDISRFPVIGRKTNYHSHGNWIFFIRNPRRLKVAGKRHHYLEFIRGTIELRVHVIGSKVIRISRKVPNPEFIGKINKRIRSHKRGWVYQDDFRFVENNSKLIHEVNHQVLNAMKLSRLTFGACDVIVRDFDNLPYILEINTAPHLNKYGRRLYEKHIRELIGKKQRRWFREEGIDEI